MSIDFEEIYRILLHFLIKSSSGCRVMECAGLKREDLIETQWGCIALVEGKTGERIVPLGRETYNAMMEVVPLNIRAHRLSKLIAQAFRDARVTGTAHWLRHTFGTLWNADVDTLQEILGHSSIMTTKRYRHFQIERLCLAHRQNSPLNYALLRSRNMI